VRLDHLLSRETCRQASAVVAYPRSDLPGFQTRALFFLYLDSLGWVSLAGPPAGLSSSLQGMARLGSLGIPGGEGLEGRTTVAFELLLRVAAEVLGL
jgi:hypothetical protein